MGMYVGDERMSRRVNTRRQRIEYSRSGLYQSTASCPKKRPSSSWTLYRRRLFYGVLAATLLGMSRVLYKNSKAENPFHPDAIVIGSGLAGLAATLSILDRGGQVVLIEKEPVMGGNSNKASSGINACCYNDTTSTEPPDSLQLFRNDTIRSAGRAVRPELINALVQQSAAAVDWLHTRTGVDLSVIAQLGGHSAKRTRRPAEGMVGAEIIFGMQRAVQEYEATGQLRILLGTKVTQLIASPKKFSDRVEGVECVRLADNQLKSIRAPHVILATGGFAANRSHLFQVRPDLASLATTAGAFSTGDGISLATAMGAGTVDMDKVQVHPTGWVDPEDPENTSKVLAAEVLRGVGGLLWNKHGKRFCNELGTRDYVSGKMMSAGSSLTSVDSIPNFSLVLSMSAAKEAEKYVQLYTRKGLMTRFDGVEALAKWMNVPVTTLVTTLKQYQDAAANGTDEFGKVFFRGVPTSNLETEIFYAGTVTPVVHYCMGGISIDSEGSVLNERDERVSGLYAAGEVSGGVHGDNRLGGNSLLECVVFGTRIGRKIPIELKPTSTTSTKVHSHLKKRPKSADDSLVEIGKSELQLHNTPDDCWVAVHGLVYDLTRFAERHPAGPKAIHMLGGRDGTKPFAAVHNKRILEDLHDLVVGRIQNGTSHPVKQRSISRSELATHNTTDDCWVAVHGTVYDLTAFAEKHSGGSYRIQKHAGKDATDVFAPLHKRNLLDVLEDERVGLLKQ